MELGGPWSATIADEQLRRTWLDDPAGDTGWNPVPVPGHWRSTPAFADTDGPLLYRTRFDHDRPEQGERWWLTLDGLFYQGDVWLDGSYLGDTEGYFVPHSFEVTGAFTDRAEHALGVEVTCARPADRTAKRNITGVFQHWDCLDPDWNPGGIWRPIRLERSGPVRICQLRVLCREATPERAVVGLRAVLDSVEAVSVTLRTKIGGTDHRHDQDLAAGENQVTWSVTVPEPDLWWPRALGDQPLHDVRVEVAVAGTHEVSDRHDRRIGLRQVALRNWVLSVNGERLFVKGSNQGPSRMALAEATGDDLARDVGLAADVGLDLLRLHAHVTRPEVYDAADEAGLLLWQDFPLQWGYARGIRRQAARQATAAVDLLGHHPSVVLWCGHNEPFALDVGSGASADGQSTTRLLTRFAAGQELPSWNKTVLDRAVKRAFERADGTRPVVAHSGVLPHPPMLDGTDSHLYFGWYHGHERDLPGFAKTMPRMVRFVSEFGAQAVPESAEFCEPERWPDLDWDRLAHTHALQKSQFDRRVPPAEYNSFEAWRAATQAYQATVVKHHVETLRRLKYRPTGGFAHFSFADGHPAVTWSVLGHDRIPKAAYHALAEACRPVIVVADRLPAVVAPGDPIALDVHVVSDRRHALDEVVVTATLSWPGGHHGWRWGGDVPADDCVRVGTLQFVVPDVVAGELSLDLDLSGSNEAAANAYTAVISAGRDEPLASRRRR